MSDKKTPTHELVRLTRGDVSLRHIASGEVMHSNVGPREEARLLYVEQSRLAERLARGGRELVLWDVGLGAATNALAALQCWQQTRAVGQARAIHVVSFECDLAGTRLALENHRELPYFEGFENAVETLLERKCYERDGLLWELHEGDFRNNAAKCPAPELVYFDFYSPKANPELWDVSTFKIVREAAETFSAQNQSAGTDLFTYSASTRVRVALLVAGFFVGFGRSTGTKSDTTAASTRFESLENPLDARWLERFQRSHEPLPHGWPLERKQELFALVLNHKQFEAPLFYNEKRS